MSDNKERFEKIGSLLGKGLDKATSKLSSAVENFDANQVKENVTDFSKKVIQRATEKYDEAVGDDKYCALCGKKLGIIGKRKIADGTLCNECSTKYSPVVEGYNLVLSQLTTDELVDIKREHDIKEKKQLKYILIGSVLFIALMFGLLGIMSAKEKKAHENQIKVKDIEYSLYSDNKDSIQKKFSDAGFSNFEYVELDDLSQNKKADVGKVEKIEINGDSNIKKIEWAEKDAKVTIYYHVLAPEKETSSNNSIGSSSSSKETMTVDEFVGFVSEFVKQYETEHSKYEVKKFMGTVFINNITEGIHDLGNFALQGNADAKKSWDGLAASSVELSKVMKEVMDSYGLTRYDLTVDVLDDTNTEMVLIEAKNGELIFDGVNNIDNR